MEIGIIGAGNVGSALARGWAQNGHNIIFAVPQPDDAKTQAAIAACKGRARAVTVAQMRGSVEVIVLATPWSAVEQVLGELRPFDNEVLIDATNPLTMTAEGLQGGLILGHSTSGAEQVAQWTSGARVVKAFNTIGASCMSDPRFKEGAASMLICGNDASAKGIAMQLARELGFAPEDAGPLTTARLIEPMAMLWIRLALTQGFGQQFGFKIVRR